MRWQRAYGLLSMVLLLISPILAVAQLPRLVVNDDEQGYRTIRVEVQAVPNAQVAAYEFWFADREFHSTDDATFHSRVRVDDTAGLIRTPPAQAWDACWSDGEPIHRDSAGFPVISPSTEHFACSLAGMIPGVEYWLEVVPVDAAGRPLGGNRGLRTVSGMTVVPDERTTPPDTRPVLFALGSIVLSAIALLSVLRWRDARLGRSRSKLAHIYIAPALIALTALTFYPILYGFWLSVTDANQAHLGEESFVWLSNFHTVLTTPGMLRVTLFTFVWSITNVVGHVLFGLVLAIALNRPGLRGRTVYRTILLLPWAIPAYISVLAWNGMLQPDGLLNAILGTEIEFFAHANAARVMVILVNIWLGIPFMMAAFSGALQAIPQDMYEAAALDGVSRWDQLVHLTLPNLKSTAVPVSLLGFIWSFNSFNTIYLLSRGAPYVGFGEPGATDILVTYVFEVAFKYGQYGVAAAWSVLIFFMLFAFSWIYMKKTRATEAAT